MQQKIISASNHFSCFRQIRIRQRFVLVTGLIKRVYR